MNKTSRVTSLADKHSGQNEKKQTSVVTQVDGLSQKCRQTCALRLIKMETLGPQMSEVGDRVAT